MLLSPRICLTMCWIFALFLLLGYHFNIVQTIFVLSIISLQTHTSRVRCCIGFYQFLMNNDQTNVHYSAIYLRLNQGHTHWISDGNSCKKKFKKSENYHISLCTNAILINSIGLFSVIYSHLWQQFYSHTHAIKRRVWLTIWFSSK